MFYLNVDKYCSLVFNCNVLFKQIIKVFLKHEHSFQVCVSQIVVGYIYAY